MHSTFNSTSTDSESLLRILLVEDNDTSRQLMCDYLEYHGCKVSCLSSGASIWETLTAFQPHIVLLDLKLPDVDGYMLLQQLQQDPKWSETPVIVISAFAFQSDQQRALALGARRYLVKPVNLAQLKQVICEELNVAVF